MYVFPLAGVVYDIGCHLIAGETCECPGRECDTVKRRDAAHAVVVREQSGYIGVASAVACVYHEDQSQYQDDEESIALAVLDAAGQHHDRGQCDGDDEDDLVNSVSVL